MEFGQVVCTDAGAVDGEGQRATHERSDEWKGERWGEGVSPT
jgi:hypothetical protein